PPPRAGTGPAGRVRGSRATGIHQEDLASMAPQAQWLHSFVTDDKIYCLYLADKAEGIGEHARRSEFPADHVALVRALMDPTTERPLSRANSHRLCRCRREHTLGSRQHFDPSATMRTARHRVSPAPPSTHGKETAMHPSISHHLATARAAEL